MSLILDAGALIAYERGSRTVQARTTTAVVAQTRHGDRGPARLATLLRGIDEHHLTREGARLVGRLLRRAGTADVVDGTVVDVARDGDEILTGDPDDIRALTTAAGKRILVTRAS